MNLKKTIIYILTAIFILTSFTACNQGQAQEVTTTSVESEIENLYPELIVGETDTTVTYLSTEGELTVTKKPQKAVILMNSILDLWYLAGGEAIARVDGTTNVPPEAMDVPSLGKSSAISMEELIALEPDLVILSSTFSSQVEMIPILEDNGIEYVLISGNIEPYESFKQNLYLFSKILDKQDIYDTKIAQITNDVQQIIDKASQIENKPSAVILYSSAKNVMCELPNSLTGDMAEFLGVINIAGDAGIEGANKVDFSMEILLERDPDFVLITTMGDVEECKARVEQDIVSNEAWNSLTAVKEGRIYYLPKDLFMYKPNARYPEAFEELAKIVYPEVFGGGQ
ncbi:MAG: ABC transporter substrate-binding protein [Tissierellales bacterium]|nr:ABC transporter substrate-binding protein [Tissierellales bacterium]MBN2826453.1 ABC transporter substrate-binding protein [Tissierellales bacterium]